MTQKQMRMFFGEVRKAAAALGLSDPRDVEEYRRKVLREEARVNSSKDVGSGDKFNRVMRRLFADQGDYARASGFGVSDEAKVGEMIDDCTRQLFELSGRSGSASDRLAYALSVLDQSGIRQARVNSRTWWMDFAPDKPMRVFYALDTHRRRLLKRRNAVRGESLPLAYRHGTSYA